MWLKNWVNCTAKEAHKWDLMAIERCVTCMACKMRLVRLGVFQCKDVEEARKLFGDWCSWVQAMRKRTGELLEPMARAARMNRRALEENPGQLESTTEYRLHGGLNRFFPADKRKACGYWSVRHMGTVLYFVAGKLTLPSY